MLAQEQPPTDDELEVSVFGPGRGECIVVHVPRGPWFVVDSLRLSDSSRTPVACAYLRSLKVASLYGMFITHWHSDHTAGAADVVRAFGPSLQIAGIPSAATKEELASFVAEAIGADLSGGKLHVVKDLVATMAALGEVRKSRATLEVAVLDSRKVLSPHGAGWTLTALSPSTDDVLAQLATLLPLLPGYNGPTPTRFDKNSGCAVLHLDVGTELCVVLSSDLDVGAGATRGWQAIVAHHGARLPAQMVKVGHHGSKTSFHTEAWELMSSRAKPVGVITPFPAAGGWLPRKNMLEKLAQVTSGVYVTSTRGLSAKAGAVPTKATPFVSYAPTSAGSLAAVGHVRFRLDITTGRGSVEKFGPAKQVA